MLKYTVFLWIPVSICWYVVAKYHKNSFLRWPMFHFWTCFCKKKGGPLFVFGPLFVGTGFGRSVPDVTKKCDIKKGVVLVVFWGSHWSELAQSKPSIPSSEHKMNLPVPACIRIPSEYWCAFSNSNCFFSWALWLLVVWDRQELFSFLSTMSSMLFLQQFKQRYQRPPSREDCITFIRVQNFL
jgi:hypothetical protein